MKTRFEFKSLLLLSLLFVGITSITQTAQAQALKPVTVQSSKDFDGTIGALKKAVADGGMMILAELNQGKILSMTGLRVNAHSFFVGNPNVGKKAFSAEPSVGLVIPVRLNVYEQNGKVYINYFKPSELFSGYTAKPVKMIGEKLDNKMAMLTKMVAQ